MRALVIYESMYGNTRDVAFAIAEGIARHMPVETIEVGAAPRSLPEDVDLLVVGGPTHGRGMTTPSSRADAAKRSDRPVVSPGIGLREWIGSVRPAPVRRVATFDTRVKGPAFLFGSAAKASAKELQEAGVKGVEPNSFVLDGMTGPVSNRVPREELDRARSWGDALAGSTAG